MDFSGFKAEHIELVDLLGDVFLKNKHQTDLTSLCYEQGFILFTCGSGGGLCLGEQLCTALRPTFNSTLSTFILPRLFQQPSGKLEGLLEDVGIVSSKRAFINFNLIYNSNHTSQISQRSKQNKTEWVSRGQINDGLQLLHS